MAGGNFNVDGSPTVANIGRNTMSVGAFYDHDSVAPGDDALLAESSRGPTPGGRKKPDLVAPGSAVLGPSIHWNEPCDDGLSEANKTCPDFTAQSGTSFAAPHVAGGMALLEGAGIDDPMAQRAILINSARDWEGDPLTPPAPGGIQGHWRPDVGWGQLDLETALAERGNYLLGTVRGGEAAYFRGSPDAGGKTTLAYEMRGYFEGYPNPGTKTFTYTQTDLNLRQYQGGVEVPPPVDPGTGGGPDAVDPNDTVEQVRAPASAGEIVFKVEATTTVEGREDGSEPFALASSTPLTKIAAPVVRPIEAGLVPQGDVRCGVPVTVSARLENGSAELEAEDAEVEIELPAALELLDGASQQEVSGGTLDADEVSEAHAWTVSATEGGAHEITLTGTGSGLGTGLARSTKVVLNADCDPPRTQIDAAPDGPVSSEGATFAFSAVGEAASFECALDGGEFAPCESPHAVSGLGDGPHQLQVRAIDGAGNIDPSPAAAEFAIDTVLSRPGLGTPRRGFHARRRPGRVRLRLAEAGSARVSAIARIRRRSLPLRAGRVTFDRAGRRTVALRATRRRARQLRRALRKGHRVRIVVTARFRDAAGNRSRLRSRGRVR